MNCPAARQARWSTAGEFTDPRTAETVRRETGVDLLAISAGNVHILVDGQRDLDLDRLAAICECVPVPLVLHGGTGISRRRLQAAIRLGVAKVNYGTYLKQRYLAAVRAALLAAAEATRNPHELLGMGGAHDCLWQGDWPSAMRCGNAWNGSVAVGEPELTPVRIEHA